jgi:proline iminopeptidase
MPPVPPPWEFGRTSTTAAPLHWVRYGEYSSPPLLVLHGGPGADHRYLLPQMLELARDHELVLYDQRGGGQSASDDRSPITWRTHVEDLDAIIAELLPAETAPTIVGYSWGGLLAILFAIEAAAGRTRTAPGRLVLIDPAPVTRTFRAEFEAEFSRRQASANIADERAALAESDLRARDPEAYRRRAFELSVAGYFADPSRARDLTAFRLVGRVQQSVWESLGDFDLTAPGYLDTVDRPSIVIHGRQDPIPIASSHAAARALRAELVPIDDCGHVPYVEQPAALFGAIRQFLAANR